MSEMNKGEALRCIQKARKFIQENKITKAEKFLNKSLRMYETEEAKRLLSSLSNAQSSTSSASSSSSNNNNPSTSTSSAAPPPRPPPTSATQSMPNLNRNSTPSASTSSLGSRSSSRMTRDEEVNMVRQILRSRDFYEIVGVGRDADAKQLKKAYRKKALKCHPDRNKSPGAEEAFKKLSKAYDCLQDKRKRQIYDQYGEDSPQMRRNNHGAQFQQMTPDDIIRMFFGGDFGPGGFGGRTHTFNFGGNRQRRNNNGNGEGGMDGGPMVYIMQLLPIILVFFTMILPSLMMFGGSSSGSSSYNTSSLENVYFSLDHNHPFTLRRTTSLDTPYYLSKSRINDWRYKTSKKHLEQQVESSYLTRLINQCNDQIDIDNDKLIKIKSNEITHKRRKKLIKNLMKNKQKFKINDNKPCQTLNEYISRL